MAEGILANQNINSFNKSDDKWAGNLGQSWAQDKSADVGWGGYHYYPTGLSNINVGDAGNPQGPRDRFIQKGEEGQYGPAGFGRAGNSETSQSNPASLLGAFAHMMARGQDWGTHLRAQRMFNTFVSGSQMRSLRDASEGVNGNAVSSGGQTAGYEFGTPYKITNWNGTETNISEGPTEEISTPLDSIDTTGIRNIPGMRTVQARSAPPAAPDDSSDAAAAAPAAPKPKPADMGYSGGRA